MTKLTAVPSPSNGVVSTTGQTAPIPVVNVESRDNETSSQFHAATGAHSDCNGDSPPIQAHIDEISTNEMSRRDNNTDPQQHKSASLLSRQLIREEGKASPREDSTTEGANQCKHHAAAPLPARSQSIAKNAEQSTILIHSNSSHTGTDQPFFSTPASNGSQLYNFAGSDTRSQDSFDTLTVNTRTPNLNVSETRIEDYTVNRAKPDTLTDISPRVPYETHPGVDNAVAGIQSRLATKEAVRNQGNSGVDREAESSSAWVDSVWARVRRIQGRLEWMERTSANVMTRIDVSV